MEVIMSSKLYQKYISLKTDDPDSKYLFKSSIFYIFISDDARIIAPILNLKLTNLNSHIKKCGFPVNSLNKYLERFKELNISIKIVDLKEITFNTNLE
jgi:DNA mismatch repair ATPase MutS